jgi:hypothetical protein
MHNGLYTLQDQYDDDYPDELYETKYSRRSNFSEQPRRGNYQYEDFNIMRENNSAYFQRQNQYPNYRNFSQHMTPTHKSHKSQILTR